MALLNPRRQRTGTCGALLAAAVLAALPVHAETDLTSLSLERLLQMRVTAASSYEQSAAEAPSAVSVITAEEIRTRGYRTLAEALASLPGLYVTDDLSQAVLGSRGFSRIGDYNSRFQLSVNGVRTNDASFDVIYLGTQFPLDMALIERIEFAPGPGSSIYGSNAMLGVINVVTRSAADLSGTRLAASVGGDGLRSLSASTGHRFDSGLDLLVSASGGRSAGQDLKFDAFDSPQNRGGVAVNQNREQVGRAYVRATYGGFDVEAFGGRQDKTVPAIYFASDFNGSGNHTTEVLSYATARYQRELAPDTRIEGRLSVSRFRLAAASPSLYTGDYHEDTIARSRSGELRVISTVLAGHKVVAGVELQDDAGKRRAGDAYAVYIDLATEGRRRALYVQDEYRLDETWLLNAGVRHDHYGSFGGSTNPRLALIGNLSPEATVKLLHGSAFRAPNAYEIDYTSSTFGANAGLGPERSRSTEAVLDWRPSARTNARFSAFTYRFDDLIDQVVEENGAQVYRNRGTVTGHGIEGVLSALLPARARATASASWNEVRASDGQPMPNSPRYTAKVALDAPLADTNLRGSIEFSAVGPRLDRDRVPVPTSITSNLVFTTEKPWRGLSFSLAARNLLDRTNPQPVNHFFLDTRAPSIGRTFAVEVDWRF